MRRWLFGRSWLLCPALALAGCGNVPPAADGPATYSGGERPFVSPTPESTASGEASAGARRAYPAEYGGVVLPTPRPIQAPFGAEVRLPGAWVVADADAVPGTWGSYTYTSGEQSIHADAVAQHLKSSIRRVEVPTDGALTLVIGSESIKKLEVTLQDWDNSPLLPFGPSAKQLRPRSQRAGTVTTYSLEAVEGGQDRLLTVSIKFRGGDEAMYLWRLHPVGRT